ncbi:hypothetical protein [Rhodoblastus sp.]|uniref:hypothetical protein n=1 Tax=Rhodoblastus sp. TaxID=1962975 RepID=UPI00261D1199|nr:hypothetical protein [Rhodoblastus sp.]
MIDGDRAAVHRTSKLRSRGTSAIISIDVCDFHPFRDGLVFEFAEYPESAALADLDRCGG